MAWLRLANGLVLVALLIGCSPGGPESATDSAAEAQATPTGTASELSVELVDVTVEEWREQLATLGGEIVVVDLWATWCIPCIERFPHMVELYHRYRDGEVAVPASPRFCSWQCADP